ncbi:MAG: hypothetical protein WAV85_09330, partial [Rhodoferax sp.]
MAWVNSFELWIGVWRGKTMDVKKPQQEKPDGAMEGGKALEGFGCTIGSGLPQLNFSGSPNVDI